nr:hypothetical protein [Tanacetum cinerariifolium]
VEHKDAKKSNEMYYPMFTKVIIHYFMTKDPSIPRRKKVNWQYVRDDQMFTTIKLFSRHQNTQQFGVMFPIELTNKDIRNTKAYKEYYAVASEAPPPKTKASVRKTKSSFDTSITPPTAAGTGLSTSAKGKQPAKAFKAKSLTVLFEVAMTEAEKLKLATKRSLQETHIPQASGLGTDEGTGIIPGVLDDDDDQDEGDDDDDQDEGDDDDQDTDEEDDEGNDYDNLGLNVGSEEGQDAEDDEDELYRDMDVEAPTIVASLTLSAPNLTPSTIPTISTVPQAPTPPTTTPSNFLQDLPNFGSIVQRYMDQQMNEAVKRRRDDDANKDEEPFAGSDRGSKRRREGNEPKSASALKEKVTKTTGKFTQGSKSQQKTTSESAPAEESMQTTHNLIEPSHQEFKTGVADDQPIVEASQHPEWFQQQKKTSNS